jgi:hypothetical protein
MKSKKGVGLLILCTMFACTTFVEATLTIATFDDPAEDSDSAFFTVDLTNNLITGEWDEPGLSLDIPYSGQTFHNVIFMMPEVQITALTHPLKGTKTEDGEITFFDPCDMVNPLIRIEFDSAWLTFYGFGGSESFSGDNVTITGWGINDATLTDNAAFSFSFANQVVLNDDWVNGFEATAAFTSSAVPEPATLALLGIGALITLTRKRRFV